MTLSGTNGQGQTVTATTTTGSGGTYSFSTDSNGHRLIPGTYTITETQPTSYVAENGSVGTVNGASDGVASLGKVSSIVVTSGLGGINYNFGTTAGYGRR